VAPLATALAHCDTLDGPVVKTTRPQPSENVAEGRAWAEAYVPYVHWVEGVHQAAAGSAGVHPEPAAEKHAHGEPAHEHGKH